MSDNRLPVYEMILDDSEETGILCMSLVTDPAIGINFVKLETEKARIRIALDAGDAQEVVGPVSIPNQYIYRVDDKLGAYYIFISQETIDRLHDKYTATGNVLKFNLNHEGQTTEVVMKEIWKIEDAVHDKSRMYGFDLPIGTLMMKARITSTELWNKIKNNDINGFSLEGNFLLEPTLQKLTKENDMDFNKVLEQIGLLRKDVTQIKQAQLAGTTRVALQNKTIVIKRDKSLLANINPDTPDTLRVKIVAGVAFADDSASANLTTQVPVGVYGLTTGGNIHVTDGGVFLETAEPEPAKASFTEYKSTDGTLIMVDNDGNAMVAGADGQMQPAPDGEYTTDGDQIVVISGGKVTEIKTKEMQEQAEALGKVSEALQVLTEVSQQMLARVQSLETQMQVQNLALSKIPGSQPINVDGTGVMLKDQPPLNERERKAQEVREFNKIKQEELKKLRGQK